MKEIFPNYYEKFKCIADRCKHSCCIGWEIDIDEDTMDLYNSLDGEFAQKIRENIKGDVPHFVMKGDGRCPFLNQEGLCDIILTLGEGAISDICYLHPRFSNFYDDFTETGLGLCCEEAARIILTENEKFSLPLPHEVANCNFFKARGEVFDILQNRDLTVLERFKELAGKYSLTFDFCGDAIYNLYASLEMLDDTWADKIKWLKNAQSTSVFERDDLQIFFEQLACYFIFRHFERSVGFVLLSCWVVGALCSFCEGLEEMLDIARMYSSEIEYCEENVEKICAFLAKDSAPDENVVFI